MIGSATDLNRNWKTKIYKIRDLPKTHKKYIHKYMSFPDGQMRYLLDFADKRDEIILIFNSKKRIVCWASISHKMSYGKLLGNCRKQCMAWTDRHYRKKGLSKIAIKMITQNNTKNKIECFHQAIYNCLNFVGYPNVIGHF